MSSTDYKVADDSASAPPMMVHVVAPSSLPEGYTFEANINNDPERTFTVEVVSIFAQQHVGNILFAHPDPFFRSTSTTVWNFLVRTPSHLFLIVVCMYLM